MFTWIPIHHEAVRKMLDLAEPQNELLAVLRKMDEQNLKVINLKDWNGTASVPLGEIDPLTFLASFNRGIAHENRKDNWRFLKDRLNLASEVPDDFDGNPIVNNMASWFFAYVDKRTQDDVEHLWQLVRQAAEGPIEQIDEQLFERCRQIRAVAIHKLTIGLFWVNPEKYLPCDKKTRAYAQHKGVHVEPRDYASYRAWLRAVSETVGGSCPQISLDGPAHSDGGRRHLPRCFRRTRRSAIPLRSSRGSHTFRRSFGTKLRPICATPPVPSS